MTLSIDNALLRTIAPSLSAPIAALINSSIRQGSVPHQWRLARITLVPKVTQVKDLASDVRPIAITCPVSKVAEFVIDRFFLKITIGIISTLINLATQKEGRLY